MLSVWPRAGQVLPLHPRTHLLGRNNFYHELSFWCNYTFLCTGTCITPGNSFPNYTALKFVGNKLPGVQTPWADSWSRLMKSIWPEFSFSPLRVPVHACCHLLQGFLHGVFLFPRLIIAANFESVIIWSLPLVNMIYTFWERFHCIPRCLPCPLIISCQFFKGKQKQINKNPCIPLV